MSTTSGGFLICRMLNSEKTRISRLYALTPKVLASSLQGRVEAATLNTMKGFAFKIFIIYFSYGPVQTILPSSHDPFG